MHEWKIYEPQFYKWYLFSPFLTKAKTSLRFECFSQFGRDHVYRRKWYYRIFVDKISGKNLLSRWPFRKWKGNNTEKTKKVTEVLRGRARTIYPNGDHCRKFDVNPVKGSKVLSGHFICAVHENQLRSSSLFSALWSVPVFIEVDFCQQRRYHEIEQKKIFPCTSSDPLPCDLSVYRGHLKEIYREVQTLVGKGRKSNLFLSASELMLKTHGVCPFSCIVCT